MNFIEKFSKKFQSLLQFLKFGIVGVSNTFVDFAVLNLLMWLTGIYKGKWMILLNSISFTCAVLNSYVWNKYWTFQARERKGMVVEFSKFFFISLIGIILNTGIVYLITTYISPFFGIGKELWANIAKVTATFIALIWNFVGYKFWVFKGH